MNDHVNNRKNLKLYSSSDPMGRQTRIHVDSTSILCWCVEDQTSTNFHVISTYFFDVISLLEISTLFPRIFQLNFDGRNIHVISTYFFRWNFEGRKIHLVFTYFFWCNFDGWNIYVVSTHFFWCNISGRNIDVVSTYFFRGNFDWKKFGTVFGNLQANENIRGGFPVFVTLNSWLLQDCFP